MRNLSALDRFLGQVSRQALVVTPLPNRVASLPLPASDLLFADDSLTPAERRHAGALMRINHVGEVCAQSLYSAQALITKSAQLREHFEEAARHEQAHLEWTAARIDALGAHASYLNPLWAAGAFGLGLAAGALGDRVSLGFVVETEHQVEDHLAGHLDTLPAGDACSRAVVEQMKHDEAQHALEAERLGAISLPAPARWVMRAAAKIMTTVAYRI